MKRWLTTLAAVAFCSAVLRADVTVVQTTSVEGGMAAAMAASGGSTTSNSTIRVKGMKSRSEMSGGPLSLITITDVAARQAIVLRPEQKTATIITPGKPPVTGTTSPVTPSIPVEPDATIKPTGKSQVIDGIKCDEYVFTTSIDLAAFGGAQAPPEAAAMMQGLKMKVSGSIWAAKDAPGAAEFVAYQKASATADLAGAAMGAAGVAMPGMDKMLKTMGSIDGLAYLTEMTMAVEGTGQMAEMMKQMGAMKITTKTTSINVEPISDDLFKVPEGYTVVKQ
jgi:hypothetical protein